MSEATTGEVIDGLVRLVHGEHDQRTQQLFRQNLQVLVEIAKLEQRQELMVEPVEDVEYVYRGTMH